MLNEKFCHLHCHSEYSLLDGCGLLEKFVDKAIEMGFNYLGLTDHGNVDGCIQFQKICRNKGIIPIIGTELYIVPNALAKDKKEKRGHIVALVKNKKGWQNLLKMLTFANIEGFYKRPRVDYDILLKHSKGLIFLTGCIGSFIHLEGGEDFLKTLVLKHKNDVYIEIMPHNDPDNLQIKHNYLCKTLSNKYNLSLIATNDIHYITEEDRKSQEVLLAIQTKKKWNDPERFKFSFTELYLQDANEMIERFLKQGIFEKSEIMKAMRNTVKIAEECSLFSIEKLDVYLPQIPQCKGMDKEQEIQFLKDLCEKGFNSKLNIKDEKKLDEYHNRYTEEINLIVELGFERYFLIVWELINWCKDNDIMIGPGRGSVGSSLIAYLLDITKVDPIEYGLLFSRFINKSRIDLPDIDMDFEDIKREKIRKHLEKIYGKDHVAGISTFSKMKGRGALRDVARVFDIPLIEVDSAAKSIITKLVGDSGFNATIKDSFEQFEEGKIFNKKYPKVTEIAINLEGQIRTKSSHAAALIVSKDNLKNGSRVNLQYDKKNNEYSINWDKEDAEYVGLMKLDVLGLNALTIMNATKKLIEKRGKKSFIFENIQANDKKILDEFTKGNTVGIFQFSSLGLRRLCKDLEIDNFDILTAANALFRPGTLCSGLTTEFVERKNRTKKWDYDHPLLENFTKDTYGIILYQEQIMLLMYELAGLEWSIADKVRKIIGKSKGEEQFLKFKQIFIDGCKDKKTLREKEAGKLWEKLSSFSQYSFNKAHAVEYALISYWQMFLKFYYPAEFITSSLTYGQNKNKDELIEEAKRIGLKIQLPKIGLSDTKIWAIKDNILYTPFLEIKGIGTKTAEKIKYINKIGFYEGEKDIRLNKNIREILDKIKAYNPELELNENEKEEVRDLFEFEISNDPAKKYRNLLDKLKTNIKLCNIKNIELGQKSKTKLYIFGKVLSINFKKTNDLTIVYGNFKDDTDYCSIIFNNSVYEEKKNILEHLENNYVLLKGITSNKSNTFICHNIWTGEELLKGNLDELNINLGEIKRFRGEDISKCRACDLRKTAKFPVPHSVGRYNAMIIGEAPGFDENLVGKGFAGKAGDVLWKKLKRYGLERWMFHVTNVCKCWPGRGNATPSISSVKICGQWLEKEIEGLKPFVILALGNTSLQFFKGEKAGITTMSGTTEWDDKRNCFICYCVHPAMLLHGREEAKELFNKGIKNFCEKIRILSGDKFDYLS